MTVSANQIQSALIHSLDYFAVPALLVASGGRIVTCNRAARAVLDRRDGIRVFRSVLKVEDRETAEELCAGIESALRSHSTAFCEVVRVARPSGKRPLAVCIAPIPTKETAFAALFLIDFDQQASVAPQLLSALYGLSSSEARVAAELVRGRDREEIAAELFISVHTVRAHIKNILAKMGLHRQSDMVRVLAAGPGALLLRPAPAENNSNEGCGEESPLVRSSGSNFR